VKRPRKRLTNKEFLRQAKELGRRREQIYSHRPLDLDALADLLADYEAADLVFNAEGIRRRLEHYRRLPEEE
jgi:hypothetical protein